MPIRSDPADKRQEIVTAATAVLSERGVYKLSIRGVASRLGGSVTLVTHYYSSRDELLDDVSQHLARCWEDVALAVQPEYDDPITGLRILLHALVPTDPERLAVERAYLKFVAASDELPAAQALLNRSDKSVRDLLKEHLAGVVPDEHIGECVDYLKVVLMGATTSACNHGWSAERLHRIIDLAVDRLETLVPAT